MADVVTVEVKPTSLKTLEGKAYAFVKFAGGKDAMAWGFAPALLEKVRGEECIAEVRLADEEGKSPTLIKLAIKATGEVVFAEAPRAGGGRPGAPGGGQRVSDPAERASIEAQSALSHTLQEYRMAGDFLLRIVAAVAPFDEELGTAKGALGFLTTNLDGLADRIAIWRKAHHAPLAAQLRAIRAANVPAGTSAPASGSSGSAAGGPPVQSGPAPGPGASPPAQDAPSSQPAGVPSAGADDPPPLTKAAAQAAVLKRYGNLDAVKAAALAAYGEKLTPSRMTLAQLEGLLVDPEAASA